MTSSFRYGENRQGGKLQHHGKHDQEALVLPSPRLIATRMSSLHVRGTDEISWHVLGHSSERDLCATTEAGICGQSDAGVTGQHSVSVTFWLASR